MPPTAPDSLRFDDILVDFAGQRLLRGGVAQPLEPKAFAVLALLAATPGRVFNRDEILDAVWGHSHVTPGVLNRIVTLLRHALGEDAQTPHYLHTVHGVGYRFDLPSPAEPAAADASGSERPVDGERRQPGDRRAPVMPRARPRRWRLATAVAALAALGVLAAIRWQPWQAREAPTDIAASAARTHAPALAILPLKPIGDGDSVQTLADGLSEELICSLSRVEGLRVIARDSTQQFARGSDPAGDASQHGVTHLLQGNLQQSGEHLRVRLRMVDADSGGLLWTRDFDRDATEALALQRDIAETVAASLTLRLGLPLPETKGGDVDFLARYLQARMLAVRFDLPPEASVEAAETQLRALARERPDDARVHAWLAVALRLRAHRQKQPALFADAVREASLALRLDPARYEPVLVLAADRCRQRDWERCMALLDRAAQLAPGQLYVHADRTAALIRLGYLDQAEVHAREGVALDPLDPGARYLLARILDTRGRHADASALYPADFSGGIPGRWLNAVWLGNADEALRIAEGFIASARDPAATAFATSLRDASRALADASLWPQALAGLQRYETLAAGALHPARIVAPDAASPAGPLMQGLLASPLHDTLDGQLLPWSRALAPLRQGTAFQAHLRDSGVLDYWRRHGFPQQCRPEGDGARCD